MLLQTQPHASVPGKLASLALHIFFVLALLLLASRPAVLPLPSAPHTALVFRPLPPLKLPPGLARSGSDGGHLSVTPPSHGGPPPPALIPILPPMAERPLVMPALPVEPALSISVAAPVQELGDPLSHLTMPSSGPGSSGIGPGGKHGGIGNGDGGPGIGPGSGEGVYQPGRGGVSTPRLIYQVDPEYSEEARKVKAQGTVSLAIVIDGGGHVRDVRVSQGLGLGLDERAIEAVKKWRFEPGRKGGAAVSVSAVVEVNFRLL